MFIARVVATSLPALMFGQALAADIPRPERAGPAAATWTGFYVGANAGAAFGGNNGFAVGAFPGGGNPSLGGFSVVQSAIDAGVTASGSFGAQAATALGVQAGYTYQFTAPIVLGIEADIQGLVQPNQSAFYARSLPLLGFTPLTQNSSVALSKHLDYLGTVRGRAGYALVPSVLAYVTGGLAYGQTRSQTAAYTTAAGAFSFALPAASAGNGDRLRVGYTIGGGIEWMLQPNWSIKAEYDYYNLGTANYSAGTLNGLTSFPGVTNPFTRDFVRARVRFDGHIARVGVNYHFWGPSDAPVVAWY